MNIFLSIAKYKSSRIFKYIDQFSFALLNVGSLVFISRFLSNDQALLFIYINVCSSLAMTINVAFVMSPTWFFTTSEDILSKINNKNLFLIILLGFFITCIFASYVFFFKNKLFHMNFIFFCFMYSIIFPLYDYLRRIFYIINAEIISGIGSLICVLTCCFIYFLLLFGLSVKNIDYYVIALCTVVAILCLLFLYAFRYLSFKGSKQKITYIDKNNNFTLKHYLSIGKWSAASMVCFWIATQGIFLFFEGLIMQNSLINTRVALSLSGVIAIYFSAIENNIMPRIRKAIFLSDSKELSALKKNYFIFGSIISLGLTCIIIAAFMIIYKDVHGLYTLIILCVYQMISGCFKFDAFLLKGIKCFNAVFISNLIGVVFTLVFIFLVGSRSENSLSYSILINGFVISLAYAFFYKSRGKQVEK